MPSGYRRPKEGITGFFSNVGTQALTPRRASNEPAQPSPRTNFSLGARLSQAAGADWKRTEVSVDGKQSKAKSSSYQPLSEWLGQMNNRLSRRHDVITERTQDLRCKDEQERAEIKERTQRTQDLLNERTQHQAVVHRRPRNGTLTQSVSLPESVSSNDTLADVPDDQGHVPMVRRRASRLSLLRGSISSEDSIVYGGSRLSRHSSISSRPSSVEVSTDKRADVDEQRHRALVEVAHKHNIALGIVQSIRREFDQMDVDGNQMITTEEFEAWLHKELKLSQDESIPTHHLARNFAEADADGNGAIEFEEFLLWRHARHFVEDLILDKGSERKLRKVARSHGLTIPEIDDIKKAFDRFDLDKSGVIEKDEFKKCLVVLLSGKELSDLPDQRLDRYWREIDKDQSGTVDLEEFLIWYIKYFHVPKGGLSHPVLECGPITQAYASLGLNRFHSLATTDYDDD